MIELSVIIWAERHEMVEKESKARPVSNCLHPQTSILTGVWGLCAAMQNISYRGMLDD
jgi:hypothetical protein